MIIDQYLLKPFKAIKGGHVSIRHMTRRGDCLWGLAGIYLGDGARYPLIVEHHNQQAACSGPNSGLLPIEDPNLIYVGQTIMVPSRQKQMPPGTGKRHEASQTATGIQAKVEYEINKDKNTRHYRTITTDYTIEATMTGKISIENLTQNNYRYNFELSLKKDKEVEVKQKLSEFSDNAFHDLTDGVKMGYNHSSGQVTIQAPIAAQANAGPYTFKVEIEAPNHFSGSVKTEPLSGIFEKDRRRFKYTAEVEFKVAVTWHPMQKGGPPPVTAKAPVRQKEPFMVPQRSNVDRNQIAESINQFFVSVTIIVMGVLLWQARAAMATSTTTTIGPYSHQIDLNYFRNGSDKPGMI